LAYKPVISVAEGPNGELVLALQDDGDGFEMLSPTATHAEMKAWEKRVMALIERQKEAERKEAERRKG